jgi:saccharopine dehydrogenase (NAD+, L-lysine-forming)
VFYFQTVFDDYKGMRRMSRVIIIGAGGVGRVAAFTCVEQGGEFESVCLASRTIGKCRQVREAVGSVLAVDTVNGDHAEEVKQLIRKYRADIVINAALPYQNLPIMEACLAAGAHYIDTAVPEISAATWHDPDDRFWYGRQWEYHDRFREKGLTGVLGIGSDPGLVNVFCSHAAKHLVDEIRTIDIMDVNAGEHGYPFATNFNPEINLREMQNPVHYWEHGEWRQAAPLAVSMDFSFPEVGKQRLYLMDHDEIHSLYRNFPGVEYIKFWMGFTPQYISSFEILKNIGMLSVDPVDVETTDGATAKVAPLKLLQALLPDPASLGEQYTGKICIGCLIDGRKGGQDRRVFVSTLCAHRTAYMRTGTQAISYAAGVPPVVAALLLAEGKWLQPGIYNVEQLDPDPFLHRLPQLGLSWHVREGGQATGGMARVVSARHETS